MADRGKSCFNWITGADALPISGREVEECHGLLAVLLRALRCFGLLGFISFDEQIEPLFRIGLSLGLPDVVYSGLGF